MRVLLILGNGFAIDFLTFINKQEQIDVSNLFKYGSHVKWPGDGESGFLSYKHCPNLWTLGARPYMEKEEAQSLIDDIITCANVFASVKPEKRKRINSDNRNIYIFAYKELLQYLKYLFVYYNDCVKEGDFINIHDWPWARYFKKLYDDPSVEEVIIVTFNYDIWLERVLKKIGIEFILPTIEKTKDDGKYKFKVYKPHGSISFLHKEILDKQAFSINYDLGLLDGKADDFIIRYDRLDEIRLLVALIPPSGDSKRFNHTWSKEIRNDVLKNCNKITKSDEVVVCGLSYWHVDRAELDEILTSIDVDVNIKVINPYISRTLNAVITSLFNKYILYKNSDILGG